MRLGGINRVVVQHLHDLIDGRERVSRGWPGSMYRLRIRRASRTASVQIW
jgi:hypothetical protein